MQQRLRDLAAGDGWGGAYPAGGQEQELGHHSEAQEAGEVTQLVEVGSPAVPAGVHDAALFKLRQEQVARRAAEEELESARRLIGQGPFVVVKLRSLSDLTDTGQVEVKIGFGGGVTRHMLRAVLSLGQQAVADEAARTAEQTPRGQVRSIVGEQGDTVRLPEKRQGREWSGREPHGVQMNGPAEKPQEYPVDSQHPQGWTWTS